VRRSFLAFTAAAAVTSFAFAPSVSTTFYDDVDADRVADPLAFLDAAANTLPVGLLRSVQNIPSGLTGDLRELPASYENFNPEPVAQIDVLALTGTRHPSIPDNGGNPAGGLVRGGEAGDLGTFIEFFSPMVADEDGVLFEMDIAVMGVNDMGALLIDVTDPTQPELLSILNCGYHQSDVGAQQLEDGRWIVAIGGDDVGNHEDCLNDRMSPYYDPSKFTDGGGDEVMVFFDVTDPRNPEALSAVGTKNTAIGGSHTIEFQPNLPYAYIVTALDPRIEVVDFSDPENPQIVATVLTQGAPHAFRVSDDGTRGYSAGSLGGETLSIHDMTDPLLALPLAVQPTARNVYTHEALPAHDKSFVLVLDEGAYDPGYDSGYCPGTGFWVYDLTLENVPVPLSYSVADVDGQTSQGQGCASHYGNLSFDDSMFTMAYYGAGVRVFDMNDLMNPTEVGHMMFTDSDVWTAKSYKDGRYVFISDLNRGFEVYEFTGGASLAVEAPATAE
jgi:hypothetical protein